MLKIVSKKNFLVIRCKIKSYNGQINTNFHNNDIPKQGFQCIFLSVILINSVYGTGNNYYPQLFLKEFRHENM